jgi:hypothetical protein
MNLSTQNKANDNYFHNADEYDCVIIIIIIIIIVILATIKYEMKNATI